MRRRTFARMIAGIAFASPLWANAQQTKKMYRVGLLKHGSTPLQKPFWDAMRELGWIEGQNIEIEPRYAVSEDQLPVFAGELVRLKLDLILTQGTVATRAAKEATSTIPIVFTVADNPLKSGLVTNLNRPGGNVTGFAYGTHEEKLLEILKEALSRISRVAYPDYGTPDLSLERAAKTLNLQLIGIAVKVPDDLGRFFTEARRNRSDAVVIPDIPWIIPHLERMAAESANSRMPAIAFRREFTDAGGLLSYGPVIQAGPRLAAQVDKILKGAKAADIAIEQPTKFDLIVNLKAAKALGITVSRLVLLRATDVIPLDPQR